MAEEKVELRVVLMGREKVIDLKNVVNDMMLTIRKEMHEDMVNLRVKNRQLEDEVSSLKDELKMAKQEINDLNESLREAGVRF